MELPGKKSRKEEVQNAERKLLSMSCTDSNEKIRQKSKNKWKILEMHEKFGYNVTIMYSVKYSEL